MPRAVKAQSSFEPNSREEGGTGDGGHTRIHTRHPPSPQSALRPDMKGLFGEIQGIVISAFLLLIMTLPEPTERKKLQDTSVCYLL